MAAGILFQNATNFRRDFLKNFLRFFCVRFFSIFFLLTATISAPADELWGNMAIARRVYDVAAANAAQNNAAATVPQAGSTDGDGHTIFDSSQKTLPQPAPADWDGRDAEHAIFKNLPDQRPQDRSDRRHRTREAFIRHVDDAWQVSAEAGGAIPGQDGCQDGEEKLRQLILPRIVLQDVPIAEAVAAIGASVEAVAGPDYGINLALLDAPSGERRVTLHLRNAPLDKVLHLLAQAVDCDWEMDGNTVVLSAAARHRLRTKIFPISRTAVLRMTNLRGRDLDSGNQIAREERLLREFLQNAGVDFTGTAGSGLAFDGSGLLVAQTSRNLERVENILRRYADGRQVEIEAKFLEVQQGALEALQLHMSSIGQRGSVSSESVLRNLVQAFTTHGSGSADGSIVLDSRPLGGTAVDHIPIPNRAPQLPNAANLGSQSSPLINVLSGSQTNFVLQALEQQSGSDLMSAPRVTVLPGKTAEITVAQEFRYPEAYDEIQSSVGSGSSLNASTSAGVTITAGTPRNFQTRNVGVEMAVTPTIEDDGRISLRLEPAVTEFEGFVEYGGISVAVSGGATVTVPSGFFQPIFSVRRIRTEVTIADGATVAMGGLTREEVKEVRDKVPLLGDIPLLGKLFRSKGTSSQKRNLLIFVTAKLTPITAAQD
ncbi:MAG: hypothetical protein LBP65_01605 [Puniceicoccales bacterium]|jgi:general secretion pathway protein D|nr:hypothetical protein [Puniceicoccales bacterium]